MFCFLKDVSKNNSYNPVKFDNVRCSIIWKWFKSPDRSEMCFEGLQSQIEKRTAKYDLIDNRWQSSSLSTFILSIALCIHSLFQYLSHLSYIPLYNKNFFIFLYNQIANKISHLSSIFLHFKHWLRLKLYNSHYSRIL